MAPYKVVIIPPKGDRLDLLIPFDGARSFQDLTNVALQRAAKYRSLPSTIRQDHLKLSLGSDEGFLIEPEDIIETLIDSSDVIFITFCDGTGPDVPLRSTSNA